MLGTFLPARVAGVSTPARGERLDGALVSREAALRAPDLARGYFGVTPMFVTRIVWSGRGRKPCTQPWTP